MSVKKMDPSMNKKLIMMLGIAAVVFLILAIATRFLVGRERFDFTSVEAEVISASSTISGKNIKVIAEYEGKEYTVRNVTNVFAFIPGTEVNVYLYEDRLYANPAGIASESMLSRLSMVFSVLVFITGGSSGALLLASASSKKKIEESSSS